MVEYTLELLRRDYVEELEDHMVPHRVQWEMVGEILCQHLR